MLGLHTWSGLLLGWVSFLIFLTGTLAYFQPEITQWMQPQLQHAPSTAQAIEGALARLHTVAPHAERWSIRLPTERDPSLDIGWSSAERRRQRELLNAATGEPVTRMDTFGGRLFYSFHFTLMLPGYGYWLAGAAAMFMLVAIISGIVVHRKIFVDFFTFRPAQSPRRSWLDVHNLTSVLALPFHIAIVYTGLITLMWSYMPTILDAIYSDEGRVFFREAFARRDATDMDPVTIELPLADVVQRIALYEADGYRMLDLTIEKPTSAGAQAKLGMLPNLVDALPVGRNVNLPANVHDVLYEFHLGRFAGWPLRWLLFTSGMLGSAMIATGLIVWTLKRRERAADAVARAGCFVVERLNVGVVTGVLIGIGAYLLANRLLPADFAEREAWELRSFFGVWALCMVHPFLRPAMSAWREQLWLLAVLLGALPIVSGVLTGRHLPASIAAGDGVFASVEATMLAAAGAAAFAAWRFGRRGTAS